MQNHLNDSMLINKTKLPLSFVKNNGQEDQRAHFTTNYKGRRFFFSSDRITSVELEPIGEQVPEPNQPRNGVALELSFTNANTNLIPEGVFQLEGYHHYFRGNDSSKWQNGVPHYKELRYNAVWEGVDVEVSASEDGLKMNWLLDEPERISSIRLHWEGADRLDIDEMGNLLIHHALGTLTDLAPIAYQEIDGVKIPVSCAYQRYGDFDFGFQLTGDYSTDSPLVIDPIIQYSTYLGGSDFQYGNAIAVDDLGQAYVTGYVNSAGFPVTPGAFQTTYSGNEEAYITKFSSNGESLIYSTYLGGSGRDYSWGIAVDTEYCAYVTGQTNSVNFPITPDAFQTTRGYMFITKIAANGESLVYSTFLGNSTEDQGQAIAVDSQGSAYITGLTASTVLPSTPGAFQTTLPGPSSTFVTKMSPDGRSLIYSTYLGGNNSATSFGIALDTEGHAYVTGVTGATDFPLTPNAFQTTFVVDAGYVTKFSTDGSSLIYSTFIGGSGNNTPLSIAVDPLGYASITGLTNSSDYPVTPGAFQPTKGLAVNQVFVSKISPSGGSLFGSTYLGGSVISTGADIKTDAQGHVYVTGYTQASDFPTTPNVFPSSLKGQVNAFITIFKADLTSLIVSYYLGGSNGDSSRGIEIGPDGAIYTTGETSSSDFPVTPGAYQTTLIGRGDAFVNKAALAFYNQVSLNMIKLTN
ncbi:hypothetical protein LXJ15735_39210 [Lacrimispora xylanolytica]|uniref:SBBP repeat-containing protein n=1 Tax=Lacrimispora xylanolytica TaxID=29375 RepID=A0ABY7AD35_9FIRM|nr:SBBP repeat-containing protein [Lacrimispora xylanolytica]WAJ23703.1 SBBP repeat-containing protein [Lacrimispora xylanolytica]